MKKAACMANGGKVSGKNKEIIAPVASGKRPPAFLQKEETKELNMPAKARASVEAKESPAKKKLETKMGFANGGKPGKKC